MATRTSLFDTFDDILLPLRRPQARVRRFERSVDRPRPAVVAARPRPLAPAAKPGPLAPAA